jgi:hypothetical protein
VTRALLVTFEPSDRGQVPPAVLPRVRDIDELAYRIRRHALHHVATHDVRVEVDPSGASGRVRTGPGRSTAFTITAAETPAREDRP